jgi:hypothetical protein
MASNLAEVLKVVTRLQRLRKWRDSLTARITRGEHDVRRVLMRVARERRAGTGRATHWNRGGRKNAAGAPVVECGVFKHRKLVSRDIYDVNCGRCLIEWARREE